MKLESEITVDASAERAWSVLGEGFGRIGEWAAPIVASTLDGEPSVGAVRTCTTARFGPVAPGVIEERLLEFEPTRHSFRYEAVSGMPRFIVHATNRWSVRALGDTRSIVRTEATLELRGLASLFGCVLAWRMKSDGRRVLEELKHRIETGRPHPRKLASGAR